MNHYSIEGSVDGLKYNPETGLVCALQNQDGRSSLSLIDPNTQTVTAHFNYANPSTSRGYDDVVFKGNEVFLSYTNPTGNGDPTIVKLLNGTSPKPGDLLTTAPVLLDGALGYDTVTGKMELVPQTDPDSLKLAANGDLIFSSNADGAIIGAVSVSTDVTERERARQQLEDRVAVIEAQSHAILRRQVRTPLHRQPARREGIRYHAGPHAQSRKQGSPRRRKRARQQPHAAPGPGSCSPCSRY